MFFYTYVLQSEKDGDHYIGYTNDLRRRVEEHNKGKNFSTTFRRPFKLIYYEAYLEKRDAQEAERFYKTGYGREVLNGKCPENIVNKEVWEKRRK